VTLSAPSGILDHPMAYGIITMEKAAMQRILFFKHSIEHVLSIDFLSQEPQDIEKIVDVGCAPPEKYTDADADEFHYAL
jgi:hypothetical protein